MKKVNLVCGDYKKLFDKNKKNIFVGDWFFNENNSKNKSLEINYHWQNKEKLNKDIKYIFRTYKKFLKETSIFLNNYHNLKEKEEFWEILLFNWLWQTIFFTFDRWEIIRIIKKKYINLETKIIKINENYYIPFNNDDNGDHFIFSKSWNHLIFSKIIQFQNIRVKKFFNKSKIKLQKRKTKKRTKFKYYLKSNAKIFIKDLYLPRKLKIKLNLSYLQFNMFYNSPLIKKSKIDSFARSLKLNKTEDKDKFHNFLNNYLPKSIPSVYVEGFSNLKSAYKKINWPNKPKVIFTSIAHYSDPLFRYYVANKKKIGSRLVILQHGGKYGYTRTRLAEFYENRICDRFLTWGNYFDSEKKYRSLFTSTIAEEKKFLIKTKQKKILITTNEFPFILGRASGVPRGKKQVNGYKNFIKDFIKNLNKKILNNLEIKNAYTHSQFVLGGNKIKNENEDYLKGYSNIEKALKKNFPRLKIFYDKRPAFQIRDKYNLQIETMDGTGFLESLALNNPVMLVYKPQFFQHDKKAKKFFDELKKVKIVFDNEKKAADFINKNFETIEIWWRKKELQKAREKFCNRYARVSNEPLKEIRRCLEFK